MTNARTGWRMTSSGVQGADRACCNLIAGRVGDDLQLGGANGGIMPLDERGSRSGILGRPRPNRVSRVQSEEVRASHSARSRARHHGRRKHGDQRL